MKKLLAILCVLAMVFRFAACDSEKEAKTESSYKDAVKVYQKIMNGDLKQIKKLAPDKVWELYEEETGKSYDEYIEMMEESYADFKEELENESGSDSKITISVAEAEACGEEILEKMADAINERYEIKKSDVKAAYEVTLTMKYQGSKGTETEDQDCYIVQIQKDWYIVNYGEYDGEAYVSFRF